MAEEKAKEGMGVEEKLGMGAIIMMIFNTVFGSGNASTGFYLMGYAAIPWYILFAATFFIPYALMCSEFGSAFPDAKGGIYSWMEKSVSPKYAFVGTFIWFAAYIIWMVNGGSSMAISFSTMLFGKDTTPDWALGPLHGPALCSLIGCLYVIVTVMIGSKAFGIIKKVAAFGGAVLFARLIWFIASKIIVWLFVFHGQFAQPLTWESLWVSPNPGYQSPIALCSFGVFAIFAYGGLEAIGGLADKAKDPAHEFPKALIGAAIGITFGYFLFLLQQGMVFNWDQVFGSGEIHLGNFGLFSSNFVYSEFFKLFGMSQAASEEAASWLIRALSWLAQCSWLGAWFTLMYSPLKQLIEGTPKEIWPGKLGVIDEEGMPRNAMMAEMIIVCIFVLAIGFGGDAMASFYNVLTIMTNVGMTLPYLFVAGAFPGFKKIQGLKRPYVAFKSKTAIIIATILTVGSLIFANGFAMIEPLLDGDTYTFFWTIFGPLFFGAIAFILYTMYENKVKKGLIPLVDSAGERPGSVPEFENAEGVPNAVVEAVEAAENAEVIEIVED